MRTAEVTLNTGVFFRANDQEHKAFKIACIDNGTEMAEALRAYMREYVGAKGKRK